MSAVLWAAAAYNVAFMLWVLIRPMAWFDWSGMKRPIYPQVWQCVGMIVGVYGVGYAIAATNPLRWWPIVLVGLLGKSLGPMGFAWSAMASGLPWRAGVLNVFNDLIWWVPFALILRGAWRRVPRVGPP